MGLDLSINIKARKKDSSDYCEVDLAYWRKAWSLRDELLKLFTSNEKDIITSNEDLEIEVPISYLEKVIKFLSDLIPDRNNICFTNSMWTDGQTRLTTIQNLENLCKWDSFINLFEQGKIIDITLVDLFGSKNSIAFDCGTGAESLDELLLNFNDYEWTLVLYNSY